MSHELSPLGFRKAPFTRELTVAERFILPSPERGGRARPHRPPAHERRARRPRRHRQDRRAPHARRRSLPGPLCQGHRSLPRDFCREIAAACGLPDTGTYSALVRQLQDAFAHRFDSDGLRPVLVLDEAHNLRPVSLAMFRLLTNFEMDSRLVVSVVLAGQPHRRTLLARPDQAAMAQRLAHYATLRLLSREETRAYLAHGRRRSRSGTFVGSSPTACSPR